MTASSRRAAEDLFLEQNSRFSAMTIQTQTCRRLEGGRPRPPTFPAIFRVKSRPSSVSFAKTKPRFSNPLPRHGTPALVHEDLPAWKARKKSVRRRARSIGARADRRHPDYLCRRMRTDHRLFARGSQSPDLSSWSWLRILVSGVRIGGPLPEGPREIRGSRSRSPASPRPPRTVRPPSSPIVCSRGHRSRHRSSCRWKPTRLLHRGGGRGRLAGSTMKLVSLAPFPISRRGESVGPLSGAPKLFFQLRRFSTCNCLVSA